MIYSGDADDVLCVDNEAAFVGLDRLVSCSEPCNMKLHLKHAMEAVH